MNKKQISLTISKTSLAITLALISLQLGLGIILGYFTARFLAGKKTGQPGVIKSLTFRISDYRIHLHHWLLSSVVLVFVFFFNLFYSQFFYGLLGGCIIHGVFNYSDWKKILSRTQND